MYIDHYIGRCVACAELRCQGGEHLPKDRCAVARAINGILQHIINRSERISNADVRSKQLHSI